jgi:hypothetical protein
LLSVAFRFDAKVLLKKEIRSIVKTILAKKILEEFSKYMQNKIDFDPSLFAADLPKELVDGFTGMILKEIGGLDDKEESYLEEIKIIEKNLKIMDAKEKMKIIGRKLVEAESSGNKTNLRKKQEEFNKISKALKELEED